MEIPYEKVAAEAGCTLGQVRRRFKAKTRRVPATSYAGRACLEFVGRHTSKEKPSATRTRRYRDFHLPGIGSVGAHRASYMLFRGPILAGYEVHHLCRFDRCVEPDHLEAVTPAEHAARGGRRRIAWVPPELSEATRCGMDPLIRSRLREVARRAGIDPWVVETRLGAFAGADEIDWVQGVVDTPKDRPKGLMYLGIWNREDVRARMGGMAAALIRNFTDGVVLDRAEVLDLIEDDDRIVDCTVLLVPDLGAGTLRGRDRTALAELLLERAHGGLTTIAWVPSLGWVQRNLGPEVGDLVDGSFEHLPGAATDADRAEVVDRFRRLTRDLGIRTSDADVMISKAERGAFEYRREDRRQVDREILARFLVRAAVREALIRALQLGGTRRPQATQIVHEAEESDKQQHGEHASRERVGQAILACLQERSQRAPVESALLRLREGFASLVPEHTRS